MSTSPMPMVNMLLAWDHGSEAFQNERLLKVDPVPAVVVTIEIFDEGAMPVAYPSDELLCALREGRARVLDHDPYAFLLQQEDDIAENYRNIRDQRWAYLKPLVTHEGMFDPAVRGPLIAEASERTHLSKTWFYTMWRRYLQGGQRINALLPRFDRCGGKGKSKEVTAETERIRTIMKQSVTEFLNKPDQLSVPQVFQKMSEHYFHRGFEPDGTPVLLPAEDRPTIHQFRYYIRTQTDPVMTNRARVGEREYLLKHRPRLGDARSLTFGPGFRYQVDGTSAGVEVLSRFDPSQKLGSGRIILVTDIATMAFVGISIGLKVESYESIMLALECAFTNKVAFCKRYGIEIGEDEWPIEGLPEALMADRGPLKGYAGDNLVKSLGVELDTTGPYRADMKPAIEWLNRSVKHELLKQLPGAIPKMQTRGGKKPGEGAQLTVEHLMQLFIPHILYYNNHYRLNELRPDADMVRHRVKPYPLALWTYGMKNGMGRLQTLPADVIRMNLLPSAEAAMTDKGLLFKGVYYASEQSVLEQWAARARLRGRWSVPVRYDPRLVDFVYVVRDGGSYDVWTLHPRDHRFAGCTWDEVLAVFRYQHEDSLASRSTEDQARAKRNTRIQKVLEETRQLKLVPKTNSGKRAARQLEREQDRKDGAQAWAYESFGATPLDSGTAFEEGTGLHQDSETMGPAVLDDLTNLWKEQNDEHAQG